MMSFLAFSQSATLQDTQHKDLPSLQVSENYALHASMYFPNHRPNWLTAGAILSQFGRVKLPVDFKELGKDEQISVATELVKAHYRQFVGKLPYEVVISGYVLIKNGENLKSFSIENLE